MQIHRTDYHLNEPPHDFVNTGHYKHREAPLTITPDRYEETEALLDWLIQRQRQGWPMVNSIEHLRTFKNRMRGGIEAWDCRAGHNGALIRADGTLSPCFDLICYEHDWGCIGEARFDRETLDGVKQKCMPFCSSTCFHTMSFYYRLSSIPEWVRKHMRVG